MFSSHRIVYAFADRKSLVVFELSVLKFDVELDKVLSYFVLKVNA